MNVSDLKVGDKVLLADGMCSGGKYAIITKIETLNGLPKVLRYDVCNRSWERKHPDACEGCSSYWPNIQLISSEKQNNSLGKIMNILEKFKLLGLSEPEKTFRKLGIQDDKGQLTSDGKALYEAWKFEQDKAAFKTAVADPLLAEMEAEKTK